MEPFLLPEVGDVSLDAMFDAKMMLSDGSFGGEYIINSKLLAGLDIQVRGACLGNFLGFSSKTHAIKTSVTTLRRYRSESPTCDFFLRFESLNAESTPTICEAHAVRCARAPSTRLFLRGQ